MMFASFSRGFFRKSVLVVSVFFCASMLFLASSHRVVAQQNGPPPLIDRELFFGDPEISGAQISPDGKFIAFIKPFKGTRNIWVKRTETAFETAKAITTDTRRPIRIYFWSRDGKYILFAQDNVGDENFNVYAVILVDSRADGTRGRRISNM